MAVKVGLKTISLIQKLFGWKISLIIAVVSDHDYFFFNHETGLEMADSSQSQQHMALDKKTLSTSMTGDAMRANFSQTAKPFSEYASLDPSTRHWEIPEERVSIGKVVGKGSFSQVAKATVRGLHGGLKRILVAVKMLKGINCFK